MIDVLLRQPWLPFLIMGLLILLAVFLKVLLLQWITEAVRRIRRRFSK